MTKATILKKLQNDSEEFTYNKEKFTLTTLGSTGKNEENVLYFENESGSKEVVITVNFINQNDNYRITRIRFDRVYEDGRHL